VNVNLFFSTTYSICSINHSRFPFKDRYKNERKGIKADDLRV